ncbi:type II secretion system minor pseudopilin GspK [uncultured Massilia sp.]|uniref:type II secretion system minor pseudopilin GspK n=1 Tax=uncultured Massilia sp. TaxID=169973 RepID=UPI0025F267EE|nr:type II secretion system minor pseudopilin GspK [uncultured Massilia sp.]
MRRHAIRLRQRGVAVITALLLTTLAVSIVASLFWQQQVQVRTMENQRLQLQTKWILRGALDWATLVLDTFRGANYTGLDQAWATPLADTRLDQYIERERVQGENFDASLSGNITDASSRYNLRNLAENREVVGEQVAIFQRLLGNLQLDSGLARRAAEFVKAGQVWQDTGDDGKDKPPLNQADGVSGMPVKLLQVDDLLAVQGFTPAIVERLRPFVIVLPVATPVNVNTAPAEVLAAVANLPVSVANTLLVRRKQAPWIDPAFFEEQTQAQRLSPDFKKEWIGVTSSWFLVTSRIRLDRAGLDAEALIQRRPMMGAGGGGSRVVWIRQY